jgi:L-fucose/D-arabinose isomerase
MMRKAKVGLVCVGRMGERLDIADMVFRSAVLALQSEWLDLVNPDTVMIFDGPDILAEANKIRDRNADCIIYLPATWINAPQIIDVMMQVQLPFAVWGVQEAAPFTSVGANVLHGTLEEMGIKHRLFYSDEAGEDEVLREITCFARAAMVAHELRFSRLGLIGGKSIGAYPTSADPIQVKKLFGVEIEHIDQLVLLEEARAVSDESARTLGSKLRSEHGELNVPEETLLRSMKVYAALKKILHDYSLDYATVKCLGEFINTYVSCCAAISQANNEGIVVACQGNIDATISMQIFKLLSDAGSIMADVNVVYKKTGVAMMINCGTMPTSLAQDRASVRWAHQYEYMCAARWDEPEQEIRSARGMCPTFCCKPGKVTFGTLGRKDGQYVMHIATGEAFTQPLEVFEKDKGIWPHAFIRLDCDPRAFYPNLRSNHSVVGYGALKNELLEFCALTGVRPMLNE